MPFRNFMGGNDHLTHCFKAGSAHVYAKVACGHTCVERPLISFMKFASEIMCMGVWELAPDYWIISHASVAPKFEEYHAAWR